MRRVILILATVTLLAVGTAAPASAVGPVCTPEGPPGKPNACWVQNVLDGDADAKAHEAVGRALG